MRRTLLLLAVVVAAGCSGDDDAPSSSPVTDAPSLSVTTLDMTGGASEDVDPTDRNNYEIAYEVCGTFSPEKLASDLGSPSTESVDLAEAYAEGYRPAFRQANFEGCLDALLGEPMEWP